MHSFSRKQIHFILLVLLINIAVTIFYASIENPLINTFSMIGSRYDYLNNIHFIVWGIIYSITTYFLLKEIMFLNNKKSKKNIKLLFCTSILLVIITLVPAQIEQPFLRWVHIVLTIVYAIVLTYIIHSNIRLAFKQSVMRIPMNIWILFIWIGSIFIYFKYGHNSIYQIWFLINLPIFLTVTYLHQIISKNKNSNETVFKFNNYTVYLVMLMVINIIVTMIYSNFENPFIYTLSMIGNLHDPIYFIIFSLWGLIYSISVYIVIVGLFNENNYGNKKRFWVMILSLLTLLITVLIPANPDYAVLHLFHKIFTVLYIILFTLGLHPFIRNITIGYKKMRIFYIVWIILTWPGALAILLLLGNTGIYELWFFVNVPLILISLVLFTNYKNKISSK